MMNAKHGITRRDFLAAATTLGLGMTMNTTSFAAVAPARNRLPRWRGFNLLDFFGPDPRRRVASTPEDYFRWMTDWGFDFVRIPIAYPVYLDIDRTRPITPDETRRIDERMVDRIDALVALALKHGLHVSLNLHRAPGYCVNAGFHEPFNLWVDQEALDAFVFHWGMWARRYAGVARDRISFDLVNEPSMRDDMNNQHSPARSVPGEVYRKVAMAAAAAIRSANPDRIIIADGNDMGSRVVPELADLDIGQSCRGYNPHLISHYRAPWASADPDGMPEPKWPGTVEWKRVDPKTREAKVHKVVLGREMLEQFYRPWIELMEQGVGVHCGECGCWNKTPHAVFLAWFGDVLDILTSHGIGWGLWEFSGTFGVLDSERADVAYENWHGHKLDRKLLDLLRKH